MKPDSHISRQLQQICRAVEGIVAEVAGERMGIALIVTPLSRGGDLQYVSNCNREDMMRQLRTLLATWDAGMTDIPSHQKN